MLRGHTDQVNAVKFFPNTIDANKILLTGSSDKTIRLWKARSISDAIFESLFCIEGHKGAINCLAVCQGANIIVSGSADRSIKVWRLSNVEQILKIELEQTLVTNPCFFPLTLAIHSLGTNEDLILAVGGTKSDIQIFVTFNEKGFLYQSTLSGHEGWLRSLVFSRETKRANSDLLLASASQDKYIRLWRVTDMVKNPKSESGLLVANLEQSLSTRAHRIQTSQSSYSVIFEALLPGHDDWIYTISWSLHDEPIQLLSASADNSLAIWQCEGISGIWVCTARVGEISALKGSTTATGSTGGFWIGLRSPDGSALLSLGRTGGWRRWNYDGKCARWLQGIGISGHTKSVSDIAWSKDGSYLLSTGLDQTTRLHAVWTRGMDRSWHEMARPQIHGYDLNCIDSISETQFISGADEKMLRVFDEPRSTAELLRVVCGIETSAQQELPDSATIPVLGLSNKATESAIGERLDRDRDAVMDIFPTKTSMPDAQAFTITQPPFEDQLARHTLWPECEKLYGHGYEISAVATSHDGTVIATACKASSLDHAVVRLFSVRDWREMKPSLQAHTLTVTSLCFSPDDQYLLSVGRDRQWAIFERDGAQLGYFLKRFDPKGHSRMILDACWAPAEAGRIFATAGRDKTVKIWQMSASEIDCIITIVASSAVTAIDIASIMLQRNLLLAIGTDMGGVTIHSLNMQDCTVKQASPLDAS